MAVLHKKGILPLGTVNRKRLHNYDLPNAAQMTKKGRGYSIEKGGNISGYMARQQSCQFSIHICWKKP